MKTGFSLWELAHREFPVSYTGFGFAVYTRMKIFVSFIDPKLNLTLISFQKSAVPQCGLPFDKLCPVSRIELPPIVHTLLSTPRKIHQIGD